MPKPIENFEDASVAAIMRHTGFTREEALKMYRVVEEGQRVFNAAKKANAPKVTIRRDSLFRLLMAMSIVLGMDNGAAQ